MALRGLLVGLHLPSSCAFGPHEGYATVPTLRETALLWQPWGPCRSRHTLRVPLLTHSPRAAPDTLSALAPRRHVVGRSLWLPRRPRRPPWFLTCTPPRLRVDDPSLSALSAVASIQAAVPPTLESSVARSTLLRASVSEVSRVLVFLGPVLVVSQHFSTRSRVYDRPVCVTCGAILSFSMPVLSRHWHTGVVVSASAKRSCHVLPEFS